MNRTLVSFFNKAIEFLFYGLFFLVPIVLSPATSELFEFNKMWLTFGISSAIGFFWFGKMILKKEFRIQRTPLDIPILLFLLSQAISTIISIDSHVSLFGYYSRFNGGLLSHVAYIFLYYAFVSNFGTQTISKNKNVVKEFAKSKTTKIIRRMLFVSIASGIFVSLWGLPSHFGFDPTCKLFRGGLDVSCWTVDFQPKVRIFSTMGQPDWLAAYLAILLPISIAFAISFFRKGISLFSRTNLTAGVFALTSILFYVDLLFSRAKSGFIAFWASMLVFVALAAWPSFRKKMDTKSIIYSKLTAFVIAFAIVTFFIGSNFSILDKFSFPGLMSALDKQKTPANQNATPHIGELGGTDSGKIRLIVWKGALNVWKNNPIFGTGVESFAFAYYKYRPPEHNLTSEWNFLYNKAHNEFLNFMATTGTFGILTYLSIYFLFFLIVLAAISQKVRKIASPILSRLRVGDFPLYSENSLLVAALTASFISIALTNFFGFSVVITNIYLFMIPSFTFILLGLINPAQSLDKTSNTSLAYVSRFQWIGLTALSIPLLFILLFLLNSWKADTQYALGYNLNHATAYQQAYPYLHKAVALRSDEPVFKDEMAVNDAILATALITSAGEKNNPPAGGQNQTLAQSLTQEAIVTSNQITSDFRNIIILWKSKVRIYYTLSALNSSYLPLALSAIQKTAEIAPTEASIHYNLGVITGQNGNSKDAVKILEETVKLKPNYRDAYFALGLFYHDLAVDKKSGKVADPALEAKAQAQMRYILEKLEPSDQRAKDSLAAWTGR